MYINASDITEWEKTINIAADATASLRGNVSDDLVEKIKNALCDMAFLVAYVASQLRADVDQDVVDKSQKMREQIIERMKQEDARVKIIEALERKAIDQKAIENSARRSECH